VLGALFVRMGHGALSGLRFPTMGEIWEAYQAATFGEEVADHLPGYCPLRDATVRTRCIQPRAIGTARAVLRWAYGRRLIEHNHLETYHFRLAKDANALEPGEYTCDEIDAILAVFTQATHAGQRARAILYLKWSDIDFAAATIPGPVSSRTERVVYEDGDRHVAYDRL
jgi:integrase